MLCRNAASRNWGGGEGGLRVCMLVYMWGVDEGKGGFEGAYVSMLTGE